MGIRSNRNVLSFTLTTYTTPSSSAEPGQTH